MLEPFLPQGWPPIHYSVWAYQRPNLSCPMETMLAYVILQCQIDFQYFHDYACTWIACVSDNCNDDVMYRNDLMYLSRFFLDNMLCKSFLDFFAWKCASYLWCAHLRITPCTLGPYVPCVPFKTKVFSRIISFGFVSDRYWDVHPSIKEGDSSIIPTCSR